MSFLKHLVWLLPAISALPLEATPNDLVERSACSGNTATTRSQWCGYSIGTDYYNSYPSTGVKRVYNWVIEEGTIAPDGVPRTAQLINGQYPGPTLTANWGDTIVVNVQNKLSGNNGTSIHWHGIRQLNSNSQDGVGSITQCPTPPGQSRTYTFQATQYGTSWYHSHYGVQAWDGAAGPIVIAGPATANYDIDLGAMTLSDWNHATIASLYPEAIKQQAPPRLDNGLINGKMVFNGKGSYFKTKPLTYGKTYRLRLVNVAIDTTYLFSIDDHEFQVISADFVPIKPYTATVISIGVGQRHDIVFTANQKSAKAYWIRAYPDSFCSGINTAQADNIRAILYYQGGSGKPTSSAQSGYSTSTDCYGESDTNLTPYVSKQVAISLSITVETMDFIYDPQHNVQHWYLDGSTFFAYWNNPTVLPIIKSGGAAVQFNTSQNVVKQPSANTWQYLVIQTVNPIAHPIHLHGHDMYILARGTGEFSSLLNLPTITWINPTRRDTEMLPALGWMVIAFLSDNPGAWLLHCHIGWHLQNGFSMQIVEQMSQIPSLYDSSLQSTCNSWDAFTAKSGLNQAAIGDDGV